MNALTFQLLLKEPVLIGQPNNGDPNSAVGLDFIPGSTIRGAVVNKFLAGQRIDAGNEDFRHLFLDGTVCFLNAYPISKSGHRTLPTPLSWRKEKDVENPSIWNFALDQQDFDPGRSLIAISQPFCFLSRDEKEVIGVELIDPEIRAVPCRAARGAGVLRARALKICNTIAKNERSNTLIGNLFGSAIESSVNSPVASRIITEETEISNRSNPLNLIQNRIKIDRFTGGTLPPALFSEQPVFEQNGTRVHINIIIEQPTYAEIGLLLLLLKDLWMRDLPLGGMASIGRGRIQGEQATLTYKQSSKKTQVWTIEQKTGKLLITGERTILESYVQELSEVLKR